MKKRSAPYMWSDDEDDSGSNSDNSSTVDGEDEDGKQKSAIKSDDSSKTKASQAKKKRELAFKALAKHGYKGGPSVLEVPLPAEPDEEKDWSWSKGEENRSKETEETYEDRLKTKAALLEGEQLENVVTSRERRELSFQQKEKRKRDLGQASRGKNYVEEEKRLLRESGIYSGFDS
ncbi:OLC1v1007229C1 [Oldenlandia corymbosa var. corymbosa]|uniref:OLC1v1007229C1 n=1 Tax=Oldenlandia corymbosa var. corymbosa TaxID=529605 RepID=A0AAV1DIU2_OLDCO|nr:OLC1v1007229C1 [Oldenlandia corymbosa var. corymbosa]